MSEQELELYGDEVSLLETMDHLLNRGLVVTGEITISVANIDLMFVGINLLLGSVDAIDQVLSKREGDSQTDQSE
jgi:hypothetical protein